MAYTRTTPTLLAPSSYHGLQSQNRWRQSLAHHNLQPHSPLIIGWSKDRAIFHSFLLFKTHLVEATLPRWPDATWLTQGMGFFRAMDTPGGVYRTDWSIWSRIMVGIVYMIYFVYVERCWGVCRRIPLAWWDVNSGGRRLPWFKQDLDRYLIEWSIEVVRGTWLSTTVVTQDSSIATGT